MKLSVVIPAYNEEQRLRATLQDVLLYFRKNRLDNEVIVVNDGSTDETSKVVQEFVKAHPNVRLLELKQNSGKGMAVRAGVLVSEGDVVLFMDADNSTKIVEIEKMWPFLEGNVKAVIGSRDLPESELIKKQSGLRIWLGDLGNVVIQGVLLRGIKDTQCGFKMFETKVAKEVFGKSKIRGWGFDVEILALVRKLGYDIAEVPIKWENNEKSKLKFWNYFTVLQEVMLIKINLILNKY
jgi:dolichyl-phosphate beta-glucosyltransferase